MINWESLAEVAKVVAGVLGGGGLLGLLYWWSKSRPTQIRGELQIVKTAADFSSMVVERVEALELRMDIKEAENVRLRERVRVLEDENEALHEENRAFTAKVETLQVKIQTLLKGCPPDCDFRAEIDPP